jgi:DNA mismatch repair protein MutS
MSCKISLTEQYIKLQTELFIKHGENSVVLFQKGKFYEIYALPKNSEWFSKVCSILNLNQSRCNNNIELSDKNLLFAGFPLPSVSRHLKTLTENNYTIQIVDETKTPSGITRNITRTINSSTFIDDTNCNTNYFLYALKYDDEIVYTIVNLQLSDITIIPESEYKESYFLDLISNYKFGEIVVQTNDEEKLPKKLINKIIKSSEILSISYCEEFLKKIYKSCIGTSVIDSLNLSKYTLSIICLVKCIDFLYNYDNLLLNNLKYPLILKTDKILHLSENTISQLNLEAVINEIDNTSTPMGKRLLRQTILTPQTQKIKQLTEDKSLKLLLKKVGDLEKLSVKINCKKISTNEVITLINYLKVITEIYEKINIETTNIKKIINFVNKKINLNYNGTERDFFNNNCGYTELTKSVKKINEIWEKLENMAHSIHPQLTVYRSSLGNIYFLTDNTTVKAQITKRVSCNKIQQGWKISCEELENSKLPDEYNNALEEFEGIFNQTFYNFINEFSNKYYEYLYKISKKVAQIDLRVSNQILITEFGYNFATLNENSTNLSVKGLFHPISKKLDTGFIGLDFELNTGILLYGVNFSGKSTLLRCLGIAVILSQAGIPAPVNEFVYAPFSKIFTKIALQDNYLKNQSTFTNEILEIKNIVNNCDDKSLILADELCSGTEINSAIALVASTIINVLKNKSKFIFTTHYHDLPEIKEVKETNIEIFHIKVHQTDKNVFVYERKLCKGKSLDIYGIEIARYMNLNSEFINLANKIRNDITKNYILNNKVSRYNSEVFMNECLICKNKENLHTHHIKFQKSLKENKNKVKNYRGNLVVLCENCHNEIHHGNLKIEGFEQSSNGEIKIL